MYKKLLIILLALFTAFSTVIPASATGTNSTTEDQEVTSSLPPGSYSIADSYSEIAKPGGVLAFNLLTPVPDSDIGINSVTPGDGGNGYPYAGARKTEVITVTKDMLMAVGGLPAAGAMVSGEKIKQAAIKKLGASHPYIRAALGLSFLIGGYAQLTGYKGYKITMTYTYQVNQRVFDGTHWVNYTGWGAPKHSVTRYK